MADLLVEVLPQRGVHRGRRRTEPAEADVVGDVLGLDVESGRDGDAHLVGHLQCHSAHRGGQPDVDDVGAPVGTLQQLAARRGEGEALGLGEQRDHRDVPRLGHVPIHLTGSCCVDPASMWTPHRSVGGHDDDLVAAATQGCSSALGRGGHSVRRLNRIHDEDNSHRQLLIAKTPGMPTQRRRHDRPDATSGAAGAPSQRHP